MQPLDTTALFTAVPTKPALPRRFSLLAAGDVLSHTSVIQQASDDAGGAGHQFAPMFDVVRPIIEGVDVAICHLETPVAPPGTEPDGVYPTYGVPADIVVGLPALASTAARWRRTTQWTRAPRESTPPSPRSICRPRSRRHGSHPS